MLFLYNHEVEELVDVTCHYFVVDHFGVFEMFSTDILVSY